MISVTSVGWDGGPIRWCNANELHSYTMTEQPEFLIYSRITKVSDSAFIMVTMIDLDFLTFTRWVFFYTTKEGCDIH